jgi:hypothetical protein
MNTISKIVYRDSLLKYARALDLVTDKEIAETINVFESLSQDIEYLEEKIKGYKNVRVNN